MIYGLIGIAVVTLGFAMWSFREIHDLQEWVRELIHTAEEPEPAWSVGETIGDQQSIKEHDTEVLLQQFDSKQIADLIAYFKNKVRQEVEDDFYERE